jgi:L-ascorbate metabolism protein UlaG (beta-lactamase superfamily)
MFHDRSGGTRMGLARMLSLTDGVTRVVHCGDLGTFGPEDVAWLRGCDVLLVPAGGTYTLDGAQAADLARQVQARWTVPMHAADPRVDLPLRPLLDFLQAWTGPVLERAVLSLADPPPPGVVLLAPP